MTQQKDPQKAIEDYNPTLRFDSKSADAYYDRGVTNVQLGNRPKAVDNSQKAAEIFNNKEGQRVTRMP